MKEFLPILFVAVIACHAEDVLHLKNGNTRSGEIVGFDEKIFRVEIPLSGNANNSQIKAKITIPRADVDFIDFQISPQLAEALRNPVAASVSELEPGWQKFLPWLDYRKSPAGHIGCALGEALLDTKSKPAIAKAQEIFQLIEEKSWNEPDRLRAREGRLRCMMASGKTSQILKEASAMAISGDKADLLIESKLALAAEAEKKFLKFLEDNPRWQDDVLAIPERHKLHKAVLDLYLYPSLFYGSNAELAARGLRGAVGIHLAAGDKRLAVETCRDIVIIYPQTSSAAFAREFIAKLPPEQTAWDAEKEALEGATASPSSPEASPTPIKEPTPKKKTPSKKKS